MIVLASILAIIVIAVVIAKSYRIVFAAQNVKIAPIVNIAIVVVNRVIKNLWQMISRLQKKNGISNLVVYVGNQCHH